MTASSLTCQRGASTSVRPDTRAWQLQVGASFALAWLERAGQAGLPQLVQP